MHLKLWYICDVCISDLEDLITHKAVTQSVSIHIRRMHWKIRSVLDCLELFYNEYLKIVLENSFRWKMMTFGPPYCCNVVQDRILLGELNEITGNRPHFQAFLTFEQIWSLESPDTSNVAHMESAWSSYMNNMCESSERVD